MLSCYAVNCQQYLDSNETIEKMKKIETYEEMREFRGRHGLVRGCRNLATTCKDYGRIICDKTFNPPKDE